jgi:nickel-dependent lactate racemase
MKIHFKYGVDGLEFRIPDHINYTVLNAATENEIPNPVEHVIKKIKEPIGTLPLPELIANKADLNKICVVISDATRPAPSKTILSALLEVLKECGIEDNQIRILIATGLHRKTRKSELERMIGKEFIERYEIIDHRAKNDNDLEFLGKSSDGNPIYINKFYLESDFKIVTGYVEPHFFAGFSGGKKSIVPGIAGADTIKANHSAKNIASPFARFGIIENNPLHANSLEIAKTIASDFLVNVCINEKHKITQIVAGDMEKAHDVLVNYQIEQVFQEINESYDVVICGNGGYPLDLNLYQAVKSMALGEMAVKEGGIIISVNELSDGVGHDKFRELLYSGKNPKELYQDIVNEKIVVEDQWEIQILTRIMQKAKIIVVSKLAEDEIGNIGLIHINSVEDAIELSLRELGQDAKFLILPDGPLVLPKL